MYYIYHIPGIKIGCSEIPNERVKNQGYNKFDVLETHYDINIASKRERELQKEYGYNMDKIPYSLTVSYCSRAGKIGGKNGKGVKSPGRSLKGERNNKAKLTKDNVLLIRKLLKENKLLQKDIANMFNVTRQTIRRIAQNKTWNNPFN